MISISNSTNTTLTASYSIRQMMAIDYLFYRVYLMRVNITANMSIDMIVLYNKSLSNTNSSKQSSTLIELVSYMGLNTSNMQRVLINKSIVYRLIDTSNYNNRLNYLRDIIHSDYVWFLLNKLDQIDIKLDELIRPKIILFLSSMNVRNTTNSLDLIELNKLYYSKQRLNNETVIIRIIYLVNNNSSSDKCYYLGSYMMKYNLTKDNLINTTSGMYYLYLLEYKMININNININNSNANINNSNTASVNVNVSKDNSY